MSVAMLICVLPDKPARATTLAVRKRTARIVRSRTLLACTADYFSSLMHVVQSTFVKSALLEQFPDEFRVGLDCLLDLGIVNQFAFRVGESVRDSIAQFADTISCGSVDDVDRFSNVQGSSLNIDEIVEVEM